MVPDSRSRMDYAFHILFQVLYEVEGEESELNEYAISFCLFEYPLNGDAPHSLVGRAQGLKGQIVR